jgi:hypothetical protein
MYKIIWEKKKLLILSKGIDEIESNISLENLPNNEEIQKIINSIDKKEIKKQTQKKWNCICKNKPGLNQDMWKLIQEYSEEFNTDYIIQIKNEIINFAILKLYNIIKENHFDLLWYDSSEPDYRWAHNTILRSKEEIQKIIKIKKKYIEN